MTGQKEDSRTNQGRSSHVVKSFPQRMSGVSGLQILLLITELRQGLIVEQRPFQKREAIDYTQQ